MWARVSSFVVPPFKLFIRNGFLHAQQHANWFPFLFLIFFFGFSPILCYHLCVCLCFSDSERSRCVWLYCLCKTSLCILINVIWKFCVCSGAVSAINRKLLCFFLLLLSLLLEIPGSNDNGDFVFGTTFSHTHKQQEVFLLAEHKHILCANFFVLHHFITIFFLSSSRILVICFASFHYSKFVSWTCRVLQSNLFTTAPKQRTCKRTNTQIYTNIAQLKVCAWNKAS